MPNPELILRRRLPLSLSALLAVVACGRMGYEDYDKNHVRITGDDEQLGAAGRSNEQSQADAGSLNGDPHSAGASGSTDGSSTNGGSYNGGSTNGGSANGGSTGSSAGNSSGGASAGGDSGGSGGTEPVAICGDGVVGAGEGCDDNNTATESCSYGQTSCNICSASCAVLAGATSYCGDGNVDTGNGELCDDSNTVTDACAYGATSCTVCGSSCSFVAGSSTSFCGDGVTNAANGEGCDDGNTNTEVCGYGAVSCTICAPNCQTAAGATSYCGDGTLDAANNEECDDGDMSSGYGCSASCQIECSPDTCAGLGANCGTVDDGCGDTLNCGNCSAGDACSPSLECELVDECDGVYASAAGCESFEDGLSSWSYTEPNGSISEEANTVHTGALSLRVNKNGGTGNGPRVSVPISPSFGSGTLYFRGYYYVVAPPSSNLIKLVSFQPANNASNVDINLHSDGSVDAFFHNPNPGNRSQSSASAMPTGSWVCLQVALVVSNFSGQATIRVNGSTVVSSLATKDTYAGAAIAQAKVGIDYGTTSNATVILVDDVVIDSSSVPCHTP